VSTTSGTVSAWVPTCLLGDGVSQQAIGAEGLVPLELEWRAGRIEALRPQQAAAAPPRSLLLPRLLEPHAHLDKAFTWQEAPNLEGTYAGALAANQREHASRTTARVVARAERAMDLALRNGLRCIRSHIDSLGPGADCSWEALLDLQKRWQARIALQLVALVPVSHWSTAEGAMLAGRIAAAGGLLGGVLVPPCRDGASRRGLEQLLSLAEQHGCGVDLHIDESDREPGAGLQLLLSVLKRRSVSVPITCSHASSLSLLPPKQLGRMAERMATHQLRVVALPLTNGWLLGRRPRQTPRQRPLAPILQLQRAGVCVAVGGDNVQDPWFPGGNFDPLALMAASLPLAQLAPWQRRGLMPFTTEAARLLDLPWDGVLGPGVPADLLLIEGASWADVVAAPPRRRVLIGGVWLDEGGGGPGLQH